MIRNREVSLAVQRTLALSAVASATAVSVPAHAQQQATAPESSESEQIQTVVVTGTHVRRVDVETASPLFVLDQAAITQTGAQTVGDLVDRIPAIAGAAMNPQLNNGGGFGESNIELRGLDAKRTLILIDGQRVNLVGSSGAVDVNQLPLNYIDHVDVLKEGAGATYGSDAIGGVVNFITRKNFEGFELTGDWGGSDKGDARHHEAGILWGGSSDKSHFVFGATYNQQDELTMGQRKWSQYALYLYSGSLTAAGSSRTPTGRIFLNSALKTQFGCGSVTRKAGTDGSTLADYRCFAGAPDKFNFQPYNLNVTPQERAAFFTKANYDINQYASVYGQVIYNHTHAAAQIAPLPFDANADQIIISKNSIYNPFGIDFGGGTLVGGANPEFDLRLSGLGPRFFDSSSTSIISRAGVKGKILDTGWEYDASISYNKLDQERLTTGYLFFNQLQNAVGPSFIDAATGTPTCGTPAAPIANCIPADIFNLTAPSQAQAVKSFAAYYNTTNTYVSKAFNLDANGPLLKLPAGEMLGAAGIDYSELFGQFETSAITVAQPPDYLNCAISQEACSGNSDGSYNFKEIYAEVFVPLLADAPLVKALNLDGGIRYSKYSLFGNTTRASFKLEYRPVSDMLVRGTFAQIFRAPTILDISAAPAANAPTLNDLCNGYTGANTAKYPHLAAACQGVPTDGTFKEAQNQVTGLLTSNRNLKPETGNVKTFGVVFDPSVVPGLSVSADYWDYKVDGLLTQLDPNFAIQQCATTGASEFCNLISRYQSGPNAGQMIVFDQPTFNLGNLETDGIDFAVSYSLKRTPVGDFRVTIDETHLMKWQDTPAPGAQSEEIAGQFNKQFGFYARNRATVTLGWSGWGAEALFTMRHISGVSIPLTNADATGAFAGWTIPSVQYYDLTAGYTFEPTHTTLKVGMLNITDRTPPIAGINSWNDSAVTDVLTYDTIGRRFFVGVTQKF
jgi:outer membrane receptor protein involved in Fe transport